MGCVAEADWTVLRDALLGSYDDLTRRLTRRFRSSDLAHDALQDTYIRIEKGGSLGPVDHPLAYVLRIATNMARDRLRSDQRFVTANEIDAAFDIADEAPDPAQSAEARSDLAALERALSSLPARRQAIFLAAWKENLPPAAIAQRYGLSKRRINVELELAREHCAAMLKKSLRK